MKKINLIIFDWAGTTVDYGCFAPVKVFIEIFKEKNIMSNSGRSKRPYGNVENRSYQSYAVT